tara:strand:+ start:495 stop:836 length:342 start_codon:yes stop_codon:yes gene_type:complete
MQTFTVTITYVGEIEAESKEELEEKLWVVHSLFDEPYADDLLEAEDVVIECEDEEITLERCDPPCKPRRMLGTSWHKNLGFNIPCDCAEYYASKGFRNMSDIDWAIEKNWESE